ncbi:M48 family metalloprotease [Ramlibacter sp. G-1-2-2]|uniref:M48 family metalloprotease n=2 Tax=Ramlibacter agri TaxID=2728837 RepID=A0A848H827_9BURK|nr:M48 family metalloprotease [Ramlibacter agri]
MFDPRTPGRRAFLRSGCRHCMALAALAGGLPALAGEADDDQFELPARFKRPSADSDEGGLWAMMDREEQRIRRSPLTLRDAGLQDYLRGLITRLVPEHAPDIRSYPVRMPLFNAMMAPNGMMIVWSGLLLRVENEAQLAAIVGHELGHYLERHTVEQLRAQRDAALVSQFVGLIGGLGAAAGQIGIMAGMFAYSREHEARADRLGMRLMKHAGYDGHEAVAVWANLLAEDRITGGEDAGSRGDIFATHPPTTERRDELRRMAENSKGELGADSLRKAFAPLRFGWIQDEIKRGQYEESLVLFDRILKRDGQDAEALYARGEIYRLRDEGSDNMKAMDDLQHASMQIKAPAETFRSLGLLYQQRSDAPAATAAFQKYLAVAPQAADAGLVRGYLTDLKP